jgi:hypothetical protein
MPDAENFSSVWHPLTLVHGARLPERRLLQPRRSALTASHVPDIAARLPQKKIGRAHPGYVLQ